MARVKKRGIFFSIDALVAIVIIFLIIIVAYPVSQYRSQQSQLHHDLINTLSTLKITDVQSNPVVSNLISSGKITDLDKSVLHTIAELSVIDRDSAADLAGATLDGIETNENIGLWVDNVLIWSEGETPFNEENLREIDTTRQVISGVQAGKNVTGFSARAFLTNSLRTEYTYFGGYVGDGNISTTIEYNGNISSAEIEGVINNEFELLINGVSQGTFQPSQDEFDPVNYTISTADFHSGKNKIKIQGKKLHIAGGFIKIVYDSNVQYQTPYKYKFPEIEGLVNIYDGFYIPNTINSLEISLNLNTNGTVVFLNIGNTTIYNGTTTKEESINFSNSNLSQMLNYNDLVGKTVPLRIGLENVTYSANITGNADVFSVTDLSGSMKADCNGGSYWCCVFSGDSCRSQQTCNSCGGDWENKMEQAKIANKEFMSIILNYSNNRLGLVGYEDGASNQDFHQLSQDNVSLEAKIDEWDAEGYTCICCGINKATTNLVQYSTSDFKSMVVMSDGAANVQCPEQNQGSARQDAIKAACDAYNDYDITVYAVGFGSDVDEQTLQSIADCGNGEYFYADLGNLSEIYNQIAQEIIETSYKEQSVETSGNVLSTLKDSFIEFNYTQTNPDFGLIITTENQFNDEYNGTFEVPENSSVLETNVISYSGPRWTDTVQINNQEVYKLEDYGSTYIELGDPYSVNIPTYLVNKTNLVTLITGLGPGNQYPGSSDNKIISTISKNVTVFTEILTLAEGCIWNIQFEDDTTLITPIPETYQGTDNCYYDTNHSGGQVSNTNDAYQIAVLELLSQIDLDRNNKIDVKFTEQNLKVGTSKLTGIPFSWQTEIQARTWR